MFSFSSIRLILLVSAFITLLNNQVLLKKISERLDVYSLQGMGFTVTILFVVFTVLAVILLIFGIKYLLKPVAVLLLVLSSVLSYFSQQLGVIFDVDMIRNIIETIKDNNQQEALELISTPLLLHLFLYGILPSIFVVAVKIRYKPIVKELAWRILSIVILLMVVSTLFFANYKFTTYFARENRDLRVYIIPLHAFDSMKGYIRKELRKHKQPLKILGNDATQKKISGSRIVGIMVVGETARWDHFSINGYARETNPELKQKNIINYSKTRSCGTSTAFSVPCMFSFLDRSDYSPEKAARQTNALDVLKKSGVNVVWIDNNSSCKGVCDRIGETNIRDNPDENSPFYQDGEILDGALVGEIDKALNKAPLDSDLLLVVHTMGSHGPKYYRRYPEAFSKFEPACKQATPQECSDKEIINAYDNTILYTDHVISKLIEYLDKQKEISSFLLYASDHGESLGEKGLYLHGLPYFMAPIAQTRVPMLSWFSQRYATEQKLDLSSMKAMHDTDKSHDNLSYSLLDAFNVHTTLYRADHSLIKR